MMGAAVHCCPFVIRASSLIRHSCFVIRHFRPPPSALRRPPSALVGASIMARMAAWKARGSVGQASITRASLESMSQSFGEMRGPFCPPAVGLASHFLPPRCVLAAWPARNSDTCGRAAGAGKTALGGPSVATTRHDLRRAASAAGGASGGTAGSGACFGHRHCTSTRFGQAVIGSFGCPRRGLVGARPPRRLPSRPTRSACTATPRAIPRG